MKEQDYLLYLVTDRSAIGTGSSLGFAVEQAVLGGCTMVQLREKQMCTKTFYDTALKIKHITDRYCIPLIINDRVDIALATEAEGVHIGQSDLPVFAARKVIGKNKLLGVSVSTVTQAMQAQNEGADYLGVGAMAVTKTKPDATIVSIETLKAIRHAVSLPIVVIGGINQTNAAKFIKLGFNGVAVVSAILAQPDIKFAAQQLRQNLI